MQIKKHQKTSEKTQLHPRNKHRGQYDFELLTKTYSELAKYVKQNNYQNLSIDFFNPEAVKALNKALLKQYYNIDFWEIPDNYLCPPIPGRADYIHNIADLLNDTNLSNNNKIKCLDIGTGANCIYPIIGIAEYNWNFIASDIDKTSLKSAQIIIDSNKSLEKKIELRLQDDKKNIFKGIIKETDKIDVSICNPPFHASAKEAQATSLKKLNNLKNTRNARLELNFGGISNELWCEGGEEQFIKKMIVESMDFASNIRWFTTLVSKSAHLETFYLLLNQQKVREYKTMEMGQGNKISRIIAWTY
jgi:23S rRNA (adenine1618-N6)-methyltransferase